MECSLGVSHLSRKRPRTSKTTLKKDKVEEFTLTSRDGNPLQYSCLKNPKDTEAWGSVVHGVTRVRLDLVAEQEDLLQSCSDQCNVVLP